jgi:hypothetical protein
VTGPGVPEELQVVVNARHLTGPRTGIEVYMEELLRALAATGRVRITALGWSPLKLGLPGVHEVIPVRRPELRAGSPQATLWKLWFDQWACLRPVQQSGGILFHGMDGFLPYALRRRDRCVATVHDLGWQAHPEMYTPRVRLMYQALFPWVVRRADRFIAVSRYTADDLVRRAGIPAAKIAVGLPRARSGLRRTGGRAGGRRRALHARRRRRVAAEEHPPPDRGVPSLARAERPALPVPPAHHRDLARS